MACPNTQGCPGMWSNHVGGLFWYTFKLDLLVPLPSLIPGLPTRPSTPFYSWKPGACLQVSTFRNLTLWNPRVGFTPWLGSASLRLHDNRSSGWCSSSHEYHLHCLCHGPTSSFSQRYNSRSRTRRPSPLSTRWTHVSGTNWIGRRVLSFRLWWWEIWTWE